VGLGFSCYARTTEVKKTTEDSSRRGKEAKQEEESFLLDFPRELSKTCSLLRRFCLWLLLSSSRRIIIRRRSERLQIGDPGRKKGVKKERKKERKRERMSQNLEILGDRQTGQDVRTQNGTKCTCSTCVVLVANS
jgi:hypothetical protein